MALPDGRLIQVRLPRACCGLIVAGGRVVWAAPYLWRYVGMDEAEAAAKLRAKGATFTPMNDTSDIP